MRLRLLVALSMLTASLLACGGSSAPVGAGSEAPSGTRSASGAADPEALAHAEAERLLALVQPPSGSEERDDSPVSIEDDPPQTTDTDDIVNLTSWWVVPMAPADVLAYFSDHGVGDLDLGGTGTAGGPDPTDDMNYDMFDGRAKPGINSETVLITVASDGHDGAAIRADAQVVWLPARTAEETIPADLDRLDVSAYVGNPDDELGHETLTGQAARDLVQIINDLPTALRGVHGCGPDVGYTLRVVAGPLVFVDDVACRDIVVTSDGRAQPLLAGSEEFVHAVASSLGLPDRYDPQSPPPSPVDR